MSILTTNVNGNTVVKLFDDGINIDQKLPKWVNASKIIEERRKKCDCKDTGGNNIHVNIQQGYTGYIDAGTTSGAGITSGYSTATPQFIVYNSPEPYEIKTDKVSFDDVAAANLQELTILIKKGELNNVLSGYGGMHNFNSGTTFEFSNPGSKENKKLTFLDKIKNVFTKKGPEMSVIDFFTKVKLESKEGAEIYVDRVSKYLRAIHNAYTVGQTALVEKLLLEMIANKYEALLASRGVYYAIGEKRIIDFAEKTERGVSITYLKNFARPIPDEVIQKIVKANEYEVFDNYVIMHYDPKGEQKQETKKEEAKRKDPIVFGVIAGSRKLYYITDWIDEHCDLTLEKFVDTLGTTKEEFAEGVKEKEEKPVNKEEKKVKKSKKKENGV